MGDSLERRKNSRDQIWLLPCYISSHVFIQIFLWFKVYRKFLGPSWQSADGLSFLIHTFIKLGARLFLNMDRFIEYVLDLTFYIKVKRFQYYPVMTLVVPCVMTAMLIVLTFILPPDAGEKVGLSKYWNLTILDDNIFFRYHNSPCYGCLHGPVSPADPSYAKQIACYRPGNKLTFKCHLEPPYYQFHGLVRN